MATAVAMPITIPTRKASPFHCVQFSTSVVGVLQFTFLTCLELILNFNCFCFVLYIGTDLTTTKNSNGSTYYNDGKGGSVYTPPGGKK